MGGDFVQQQDGGQSAPRPRQFARIRQHDGDQQRLLFAGGTVACFGPLGRVTNSKVGDVRSHQRAAGLGIAHAAGAKGGAHGLGR